MNQKAYKSQHKKSKNRNTPSFWDKKIKLDAGHLNKSPIYMDKLGFVIRKISKMHGNLLDVGFGHGYVERIIVNKNLDFAIHGIDISGYAVESIKSEVKGKFVVSNIFDIPFSDNYFDCTLLLDVIEHIDKDSGLLAMAEVNRILKKNGILVLSVPLNESSKDYLANRHVQRFNKEKLKKLLNDSGFLVIESKFFYAFPKQYRIKSLISNIFHIKKPNLIIVIAKKI